MFSKDPSLDVRSAGTSTDAMVRVNDRMLEWADIIFTMDDEQRRALSAAFPNHPGLAKIVCLEIADDYHFLDPELIAMLRERTAAHLERLRSAGL